MLNPVILQNTQKDCEPGVRQLRCCGDSVGSQIMGLHSDTFSLFKTISSRSSKSAPGGLFSVCQVWVA